MSTFVLRNLPISVVTMVTSVIVLCATFLAWSVFMRSGHDFAALADGSLQIAEVDSRGRLVRLGSSPLSLALLFGIVTTGCLSFAWGALQLLNGANSSKREADEALSARLEKVGQELDEEVLLVMRLLKQHLELSGSHSDSLEKVSGNLLASTSPEQMQAIVQFLIAENNRVKSEVNELNARLQNSQLQIEKLRVSLSDSHRLGMLDAVTSLKNRNWLEINLPKEVQAACDAREALSLIMADVDHFKRINDTFGHAVGDEILRRFAELISKNIKGRDMAARYGGEEFVILLPQTKLAGARNLGEQIRSELECKKWMHHRTGQPIGMVTASFGIAELRDGEQPNDLLDRADAKLYEAKAKGRNCVAVDE